MLATCDLLESCDCHSDHFNVNLCSSSTHLLTGLWRRCLRVRGTTFWEREFRVMILRRWVALPSTAHRLFQNMKGASCLEPIGQAGPPAEMAHGYDLHLVLLYLGGKLGRADRSARFFPLAGKPTSSPSCRQHIRLKESTTRSCRHDMDHEENGQMSFRPRPTTSNPLPYLTNPVDILITQMFASKGSSI